uniref:SGNH domain-containing protein n=1 Tax=Panagrolaimus sp. ES5 TaxID=591445 RepID=A0AC34G104_9BILA
MPENLRYCEYNTNSKANLTAIIVGNSYAMNLQYAIVKNPAFKKVIAIYAIGCPFPYVNDKGKEHCKKAVEGMMKLIEKIEADIVYLIQLYLEYMANLTAIIVGNSYAMNLQYAIVKNPAFKKVIAIAIYAIGCPFPYVNDKGKEHCKKAVEGMMKLIEKIEADIVYLIQLYLEYMVSPLEENWKNDWKFKKWNETFQFIQNHSSAVIVNDAEQLVFPFETGKEFTKHKLQGTDFDGKIKIPEKNADLTQRLSTIYCPKCFWFSYKSVFCGQNFCHSLDADTGLPLFFDGFHMSIFGLRKIKPTIDKLTIKALTFITENKI